MPVGSFSLAINNNRGKAGDDKDDVSYIDCVTFGKQADFVRDYLGKGMPILVEGASSKIVGSRKGRSVQRLKSLCRP
jgi:Single-stranded DNA-binding protein